MEGSLNLIRYESTGFKPLLSLRLMIIAVDTRLLLSASEIPRYFVREIFETLVKKHPEDQFYFLFDRPFNDELIFSSNVHPLVVSPEATNPLSWRYWYNIKLPFVLKKIRADVFVAPFGVCSLTTKVPQCLVIHHFSFIHHPSAHKKSVVRFQKKFTPKYLKKAHRLITVSHFLKQDIVKHFKTDPAKIDVVPNGIKNVFQLVSFEGRETIKEKLVGGCEYFMYAGPMLSEKKMINLLKAFSIFKKRLQSSMKLVIAIRSAQKNDELLRLLDSYKYRADVVITGDSADEDFALLLGAAYAFVYPSSFEDFTAPVMEAMKSGVPVLTFQNTSVQEIAGEAALYFDSKDQTDIAEKMMQVYKDENLRKQMIEKGKLKAEPFSWEKSAELFWNSILKTAGKND